MTTKLTRLASDCLKNPLVFFSILIATLVLMHLHVFNRELVGVHVWRQTQTQTNVLNFAFTDGNILNPKTFSMHQQDQIARYEFPYMQWLFSLFYSWIGDSILISRVLTFIISLFSIFGFYRLLQQLFTNSFTAKAGTWAFSFSPLLYYYMVNPLPDNMALCMSIWFLVYFFRFISEKKQRQFILSLSFLLLAVLAKLPFILFGFCWIIYMIRNIKKATIQTPLIMLLLFLAFHIPALIWYAWVIPDWKGNGITTGIISGTSSFTDLFDILIGNLVSTLPELLINYGSLLFFLTAFFLLFKRKLFKSEKVVYLSAIGLSLILYFLFEMNMIGTVHDYYLFPFLPLIFILVAYGIDIFINKKTMNVIALFLLLLLPLTAYLRINDRWNLENPGFNADLLVNKDKLRNAVPPGALCICGNDNSAFIWNYYLRKKCWSFNNDNITEDYFNQYLNDGATYLYSDSRQFESYPFVKSHLGELVTEGGSIRVYKLSK